jgi:branched-subunit amino acid ABC-type transport system permease component
VLERWNALPRGIRRLVLTLLVGLDAMNGLLNGWGFLNLVDVLLLGNLPGDLVWLMQTLQLISTGFAFAKIVFDDMPPSKWRLLAIIALPVYLLVHVIFSLDVLLRGQGLSTTINLNLTFLAVDTLTWSATYLAIAVGCTLTYAVQRYGNFAQSEFFMIGMYSGIILGWMEHANPLISAPRDDVLTWSVFGWALVLGFLLTGFAGVVVDRLVFKGFRDRKASADVMMIASLGVALIIRGILYLRFTPISKRFVPDADLMRASTQSWELPTRLLKVDIGADGFEILNEVKEYNYPFNNALMPILTFGTVLLLLLLLTRTRLGRRMRAVADNPELAASCGINVERIQMVSAFLSAGITGVGGTVFGIFVTFSPQTGFTLLLPAFAVIVLGTIGSIPGAIVASLVIGFVRALSSPILISIGNPLERTNYAAMAGVTPYLIIIAILLVLPKGLGDGWERWRIDRLRRRAESSTVPDERIAGALAILGGWFGLHHFYLRRASKAVPMLMLTSASYAIHVVSDFLRTHSWVGKDPVAPSSYDADMAEQWLTLVQSEQQFIGAFGTLGDVVWPLVPLLVLAYAWREAYLFFTHRASQDPLPALTKAWGALTDSLAKVVRIVRQKINAGMAWVSSQFSKPVFLNSASNGLDRQIDGMRSKLTSIGAPISQRFDLDGGRSSERGSALSFYGFMLLLLLVLLWLPITAEDGMWGDRKLGQVSNVLTMFAIFLLLAFSLNLHTGMTGLLNFGVIFFASIGAILVGILTAPTEYFGYDWPILPAVVVAMLVGAVAGWLMAGPTARLRSDYFAIITISMGEVVRLLLSGEPLLRVGSNASAIGIAQYPKPLNDWWFCGSEEQRSATGELLTPLECAANENITSAASIAGDVLGLVEPVPYAALLAFIGLLGVAVTWFVLSLLYRSPWGRILRAIREDEEVAQHHGHDIMRHKATSLAVGGAIAAFAGALWAWKLGGFQPSFMSPARSTFLVWAAFIIGGAANNRGMVVGAMIIALMEFFFNVLVAAQGSSDLPLHNLADNINEVFRWFVLTPYEPAWWLLGFAAVLYLLSRQRWAEVSMWLGLTMVLVGWLLGGDGSTSVDEVFPEVLGGVKITMGYLKEILVGLLIVLSLKFNAKGLLPEVPFRPRRPGDEHVGVEE